MTVAERHGRGQILLNQQYRLAIGLKAIKRVYNLLQYQWGETLGWLVEQ